jgi:hypothetical protein
MLMKAPTKRRINIIAIDWLNLIFTKDSFTFLFYGVETLPIFAIFTILF